MPKTAPTSIDPHHLISAITIKRRQRDAQTLLELFSSITGQPPVVWGTTIIGFGEREYKLASGKTETTLKLGFAPRSSRLVLYLPLSKPSVQDALKHLGPHQTGVTCLYIKRLDQVDMKVLADIIEGSWTS